MRGIAKSVTLDCFHGAAAGLLAGACLLSVLLLASCLAPHVAYAGESYAASEEGPSNAGLSLVAADEGKSLPDRFDLRDRGLVSPVKNQEPWGTCWAFASTAASESSILSELGTSYDKNPIDLSVRHLAWFAGTALPDSAAMKSIPSQKPYASQAGEGTTVRPTGETSSRIRLKPEDLPSMRRVRSLRAKAR